jgi:geranylgeranyl reductase family protein
MKYDVTIVGGGPAGSTAAKFLSEKGFKTLIIDKRKFPREKPCGGAIPIRLLERFDYLKKTDLIDSFSYGGIAYSPSLEYKLELVEKKPIAAMVLRRRFDNGLLKIAENSGTVVKEGEKVVNIRISDENAKVYLDNGSIIDSRIVIGADGVWSNVAKKTGLRGKKKWLAVCVLKEYKLGKTTIDNYFGENRLCHIFIKFKNVIGYGWMFPKNEHLNIGIGSIIKSSYLSNINVNLLESFKEFLQSLKKQKLVPKNLKPDLIKGGALPTYPLDQTYGNRVLLIGDAAGVINPITGEGIYYAMSSGKIGANVVLNSLESEDTSESFLANYQKNWRRDFGDDLDLLIDMLKEKHKTSTEEFFKNASKDKKLNELLIKIMTGQISVKDNKWKIARRLILKSIKSRLFKN